MARVNRLQKKEVYKNIDKAYKERVHAFVDDMLNNPIKVNNERLVRQSMDVNFRYKRNINLGISEENFLNSSKQFEQK